MSSLDPVYTVGAQIVEVLTKRGGARDAGREGARGRAVRPGGPERSVGCATTRTSSPAACASARRSPWRWRSNPSLLLADEPVTALDVIVQRQILDTLRELQQRLKLSMVMVTHDISVVAYLCDEVVVMYAGQVIESGPVREVLSRPRHPYTMGLRNAFPDLLSDAMELVPIHGSPPDLREPPPGCRFAPRCPFVQPACTVRPASPPPSATATSRPACRDSEADALRTAALDPAHMAALVELRDVVKHFPVSRSLGEIVRGRHPAVHALDGVSLDIGVGRRDRHRGRVGLRQDHARPADAEAHRADRPAPSPSTARRSASLKGENLRAFRRAGAARVPEPVRCAQPALHDLSRRRRAAAQCRHRQGRARRPRRDGLPPRPPARPRALSRPLPAPAERRPAPAGRARPRAGARRRASWSPTSRCRCSTSACAPASSP